MEQYIIDQISSGLKYLPSNLAKSYFAKKENSKSKEMRKKGFIRGVCHPTENYKQINDANIGWIRIDIPYPFKEDGSENPSFENFKKKCERFNLNGIKVMAVTPYPRDYIECGIDVQNGDDEKIREIDRYIIKNLGHCIQGIQVTNEMGIPHFTKPLNMDEAAHFIGVQLEELSKIKGDIIIGYNSAGPQADLHTRLKDYWQFCDYIGVDIYIGCFDVFGGLTYFFDAMIRYLWALTGVPVLVQEFGYISGGKPKSPNEKKGMLERFGASSEKEAEEKIEAFVDAMPDRMKEHIKYVCDNDKNRYADLIFRSDFKNHFYCEMPKTTFIPGYPHTPKGQADFFRYIIPHLYDMPYCCGSIIYCYKDCDHCYICGQNDCPIETRWGLVNMNDEPKPSYKAVRDVFGKIKWMDGLNNV